MINIKAEWKLKPFLQVKEEGFSFGKLNTGGLFLVKPMCSCVTNFHENL